MKNLVTFVLLSLIFLACSEGDCPDQPKVTTVDDITAALQGTWSSDDVLVVPVDELGLPFDNVYQVQTFTFLDTLNTVEVTIYADEGLTVPMFRYQSIGPFKVLMASPDFVTTWEADFANTEQSLEILLDSQELLDGLGFSACGITEVNVVHDITDGCGIFPGIDECIEQDIIQLRDDALRFGSREGNLCENRATSLQEIIYTKE